MAIPGAESAVYDCLVLISSIIHSNAKNWEYAIWPISAEFGMMMQNVSLAYRRSIILDIFRNKFSTAGALQRPFCIIVQNFVDIGHTTREILQIHNFLRLLIECKKFTRLRLIWHNFSGKYRDN